MENRVSFGKVVIGTVKGDIHGIAKSIVSKLLIAEGFKVVDLGIDVPADRFVAAVKEKSPNILALSALMTTPAMEMKLVVDMLSRVGLRDKVRVLVGGLPFQLISRKHWSRRVQPHGTCM